MDQIKRTTFVFQTHLQREPVIRSLLRRQRVRGFALQQRPGAGAARLDDQLAVVQRGYQPSLVQVPWVRQLQGSTERRDETLVTTSFTHQHATVAASD